MPVIVLEAKDFVTPLFMVRTLEVLSTCTTFSLVASLDSSEVNTSSVDRHHHATFRIFCMFTWCFFFTVTLLLHILSIIQFHNLIPVSWKNLTMTVAVLGSLMNLSTSVIFLWIVIIESYQKISPHSVAAASGSWLTCLLYASESCILRTRVQEQRGYMGSTPGLLKILQLWGGCQMMPLVVEVAYGLSQIGNWQIWVTAVAYGVCLLLGLITLVVILSDCAGRCFLPFDRLMASFSLMGVLFYMVATVICFTKILQLKEYTIGFQKPNSQLVIMETVVASVTLLAYTVDVAFSIKLLFDRVHT
ncbi:myeloid-associated differentiation marker-like [Cynoglossus semilaevis]|uniref:Myeloid-associated differentiation marker-like n=1 Tax=Cynoglossus semilaevis TaxID=244447 RepID=A0A3P8WBY4_CYNSE|nr:myeloid-associated differentiation marker-like [Cynoglossus semilaevis]